MTPERIREICEECGFGEHTDKVLSIAEPAVAITLTPTDDKSIPLGASRFGGSPDLPIEAEWSGNYERRNPGFFEKFGLRRNTTDDGPDWPRKDTGRALNFLAQINLEDVAKHFASGADWPDSGRLYFFYDVHESLPCEDPDTYDEFCLRHFSADIPVERTQRPDPKTDRDPTPVHELPAASMSFESTTTLPYPMLVPTGLLSDDLQEKYFDVYAQYRAKIDKRKNQHQIGGHPNEIQDSALLDCVTAYWCVQRRMRRGHPAYDWWVDEMRDWRCVFQIDTGDDAVGFHYVDLGRLYFCAHRDDIANSSFKRSWMAADCG